MHGLIFETSISLLAGSTRYLFSHKKKSNLLFLLSQKLFHSERLVLNRFDVFIENQKDIFLIPNPGVCDSSPWLANHSSHTLTSPLDSFPGTKSAAEFTILIQGSKYQAAHLITHCVRCLFKTFDSPAQACSRVSYNIAHFAAVNIEYTDSPQLIRDEIPFPGQNLRHVYPNRFPASNC